MTDENNQPVIPRQDVNPSDIIVGLGSADRKLLAAYLALFEDSALWKRLVQLHSKCSDWVCNGVRWLSTDAVQKWLGDASVQKKTASVTTRKEFWEADRRLTDDDLRLILWIYLPEAFEVPARLTVSTRGAEALATELAAAAIHAADPPSFIRDGKNLLQHWGWIAGMRPCISLTSCRCWTI